MTDKIDTSPEAVDWHLDINRNHEAGLIPMGTQIFLRALSARLLEVEDRNGWAENDLDAAVKENTELRARAEAAEAKLAVVERAVVELKAVVSAYDIFRADEDQVGLAPLDDSIEDARATLAVLEKKTEAQTLDTHRQRGGYTGVV